MALVKCKECGREVSGSAKICPGCGIKRPAPTNWKAILICVGLFFVLANMDNIRSAFGVHPAPIGELSPPVQSAKTIKTTVMGLVKLEKVRWRKEAFGSVMETDFTIKNMSIHNIKDIEVACTSYAKSNTAIGENKKIVYEAVKHGGEKQIKNFNMGLLHPQAATISCEITDLSFVQ